VPRGPTFRPRPSSREPRDARHTNGVPWSTPRASSVAARLHPLAHPATLPPCSVGACCWVAGSPSWCGGGGCCTDRIASARGIVARRDRPPDPGRSRVSRTTATRPVEGVGDGPRGQAPDVRRHLAADVRPAAVTASGFDEEKAARPPGTKRQPERFPATPIETAQRGPYTRPRRGCPSVGNQVKLGGVPRTCEVSSRRP